MGALLFFAGIGAVPEYEAWLSASYVATCGNPAAQPNTPLMLPVQDLFLFHSIASNVEPNLLNLELPVPVCTGPAQHETEHSNSPDSRNSKRSDLSRPDQVRR